MNRQRYYRSFWSLSCKQARAEEVITMVGTIRSQMPLIGTRKLYYMLEEPLRKQHVGRDKLFLILRANHMLIVPRRSCHHRFHKHKNLIANMEIARPEQVWFCDITYLRGRGNAYLSLVTDTYSKKIMGYDVSNILATEGTLRALKMANKQIQYKQDPLILHSDRGFQYCSDDYQKAIEKEKNRA